MPYHVINRGNYRADVFAARGAESFQRCLFEACGCFGWRLHAFVIMRNHFHLAVETPEPNLSEGMKWLQCTWAIRFNRFRGEVGQPFQGRYKGIHVERGTSLARVANYIHLNPICAGLVPVERVTDYRWSSLPWFLGRCRPSFLEGTVLLGESGGWPDTPAGWREHLRYLRLLASEDQKTRDCVLEELSRGWAIGSEEFRARLKDELEVQAGASGRFELLGADREAHLQARADRWEMGGTNPERGDGFWRGFEEFARFEICPRKNARGGGNESNHFRLESLARWLASGCRWDIRPASRHSSIASIRAGKRRRLRSG